jgi:hypothetical protein
MSSSPDRPAQPVAEILDRAGDHYSLPSAADKQAAVDTIAVDY